VAVAPDKTAPRLDSSLEADRCHAGGFLEPARSIVCKVGDEFVSIRALAALPDGRIVSGGLLEGNKLEVWDLTGASQTQAVVGFGWGLAALPDGRVVWGYSGFGVPGRDDNQRGLVVWDSVGGTPARYMEVCDGSHSVGREHIPVLPDGRIVVCERHSFMVEGRWASQDSLRLWDPTQKVPTVTLWTEHDRSNPGPFAVLPNGGVVAYINMPDGRELRVWDPKFSEPPIAWSVPNGSITEVGLVGLPDGRIATAPSMACRYGRPHLRQRR
jgi:hypothetical protein